MDDDDWYGKEHISDLLLAASYSNADLVGKGSEFVYLMEEDITVRSLDDTRKTKLTLKQINALRKSIEAKAEEYERDMERVQKMYAQPSEPAV